MEKATVGDIEISYQVTGEGHPLVLIQGLTATMDWWEDSFLARLARRYRVLVFDNRGAGRTEAPPGEFTIEQFADDTAGLMDSLRMGGAHVLGYSMGGMIAQELALRHPERVDKLVLCATFCGGTNTVLASREVLEKLVDRSGSLDDLVERFLGLMFSPDWIESNRHLLDEFKRRYMVAPTSAHNAVRQFMSTVKFDAYDRLPGIGAATMIACGGQDVIIPAENSRILASAIPASRLVEYDDSGHGFLWQREEDFVSELEGFLG